MYPKHDHARCQKQLLRCVHQGNLAGFAPWGLQSQAVGAVAQQDRAVAS